MFKQNLPSWLQQAVFYEIYPQSFYDTNQDGIGDIQGIIEKLSYIQSLGCNAIWVHPCFVSPFKDAGYDVADFCQIASRYGTNDDMERLLKAAHELDIKVCLDLVVGHTSNEHPWFKESCKAESNEYSNRYIWTNSWVAECDGFTAVNGYAQRPASYITNFFWSQPALNYGFAEPDPKYLWQLPMDHPDCLATREAIKGIIKFWLDMGVDGFRVDMAASLIKKDPEQKGVIKLWNEIFGEIQTEYPETVWISEWFNNTRAIEAGFHIDFASIFSAAPYQHMFRAEQNANLHYTPGHDMFGFVGNSYFSKNGKGDASAWMKETVSTLKKLSGKGFIGNFTSNHDIMRISVNRTRNEIELVFAFILAAPGVPFIYYGDEIGMRYMVELPDKEGGYTRTGSRSPMQWNNGKNSGFSQGEAGLLYLPVDYRKDAPSVEQQEKSPESLLNAVRRLVKLRNSVSALQADAEFEAILANENSYPLIFERQKAESRVLVVFNPSSKTTESYVKAANIKRNPEKLAGDNVALVNEGELWKIIAGPVSYAIFETGGMRI